jgi:predicted TIM-barrel fold metal-dependent hydrolase
MLIVDTHPHVMTAASVRYPHAPVGGRQSAWSHGVDLDGGAFASMMSAAGVTKAVLVQTSTVYGFDNRLLADTVGERPGTFAGVCSVDALNDRAPDELSHWIGERGLSGVRLFSAAAAMGVLFEVDDPRLDAYWLRAQELAVPVDLQIRYPAIPAVRRVLERYASVRVVLDHLGGAPVTGGPFYPAAADLFGLAGCGRVYVKFANHNLDAADEAEGSTAVAFLERVVSAFGADHVLWGSNFPNTFGKSPATTATYTAMVARALGTVSRLGQDVAAQLMGGTAQHVYPGLT